MNLSEGKLSIWANGIAEFRISQKVWLPEAAYNLVIYFNGGEFGSNDFDAEESYADVKQGIQSMNSTSSRRATARAR